MRAGSLDEGDSPAHDEWRQADSRQQRHHPNTSEHKTTIPAGFGRLTLVKRKLHFALSHAQPACTAQMLWKVGHVMLLRSTFTKTIGSAPALGGLE